MEGKEKEDEGEPLHHLRIKMLQRDIRHVISHQQRIIALQRLEEAKLDKEEKEKQDNSESKPVEGEAEKKPNEEEKKKEPDSDDSPEEEKPLIDLDNLPEDRMERCRLLNVEESLLEMGEEVLAMVE